MKIIANNATKLPYNAPPSYRRNTSDDVDESRNSYQNTECEDQQIVRRHESKTNGYQSKGASERKRRAEEKDFKVGERVLLRQPHKNKYSTPFCSDPFTIIKINGSQLEIQDKHGQTYKRNSAHVNKYHVSAEEREEEEIEQPTTKEIPQPHPQPEEESTPHPTQENLSPPQPLQPIPIPTTPKRRTTRITKPPERLGY